MQKILLALFAMIVMAFPNFANAEQNTKPIFIMLKFTNDTRYDSLQTAEQLSAEVMTKLINASKENRLNFKASEQLYDLEKRLDNEKGESLEKFNDALSSGDYNEIFNDTGFDENRAQTIALAQVGQFISPEITAEIGKANGADYLIQGTIINLGTGSWLAEDLDFISGTITNLAQMASSQASGLLGNGVLSYVGNISVTVKGIGVQCDVRIIKAETGEVVWCKRVKGIGESRLINSGFFSFGHSNMSVELYNKAMKKASNKIVDALLDDLKSGALVLE